jgi:hypothetical protein
MVEESIADISAGDKAQLNFLRDRYNYLLEQKWDLELYISGLKKQHKPLKIYLVSIIEIENEMLHIDQERTEIINPKP